MEAQELRIGNLVNHKDGIYTVVSISGISYSFNKMDVTIIERGGERKWICVDIKTIEPIPLTEEWLIKCGFEKRESSVCNYWWSGINNITHDWLVDITQMIDDNTFFYKNGRHAINYVHQLQNLYFALTGEELTIKTD